MVVCKFIKPEEVVKRVEEFRQLTLPIASSDMNRTITDILEGDFENDMIIAVAEDIVAKTLLGWVVIDNFAGCYVLSVFVDSEHRKKGLGTQLTELATHEFIKQKKAKHLHADNSPLWGKVPALQLIDLRIG